jgi:hypothetical protein
MIIIVFNLDSAWQARAPARRPAAAQAGLPAAGPLKTGPARGPREPGQALGGSTDATACTARGLTGPGPVPSGPGPGQGPRLSHRIITPRPGPGPSRAGSGGPALAGALNLRLGPGTEEVLPLNLISGGGPTASVYSGFRRVLYKKERNSVISLLLVMVSWMQTLIFSTEG